ncbi:MAG: hypothetical protein OQK94_04160, partial [Gammaproteobacteria bacterium]|nr:hypothetical protein [Gammaproteobacteria bacterium]MCW8973190.1 hypothetical protein [Gammaproteobacteria bacterium]MCW8993935.1 hypothetical protein [Gammaproteobacteria bacterium]
LYVLLVLAILSPDCLDDDNITHNQVAKLTMPLQGNKKQTVVKSSANCTKNIPSVSFSACRYGNYSAIKRSCYKCA